MKTIIPKLIARVAVLAAVAAMTSAQTIRAAAPECHFECSGGVPDKLCWQSKAGETYDLWCSDDLAVWSHVEGYPKAGTGGMMEHPFTAGTRGFFKFVSEASSVPEGFVLIPASEFLMGDQSNLKVGYSNELPVHSVQVSAFYLAKYEVTKALWDAVRAWGLANGYTDLPSGGVSAANHPVHSISWYAMVQWCNARSQKEGLVPCYTVAGATYKTGFANSKVVCDWNASGYRLPTEAEWEKAARGGMTGLNFPWGDTITHSQANYYSDASCGYDTSPTRGYHPTYVTGWYPYTSPVGSFPPNGYGLYDMAGNVWEWCGDWYSATYYSSSPATDPRGAASGNHRVYRGGGWSDLASGTRCAYRYDDDPGYYYSYIGLRLARSSVP